MTNQKKKTTTLKASTLPSNKQGNNARNSKEFPKKFPFFARLLIDKRRPTLVIDKAMVKDKKSNKLVKGYVHREVTHTAQKGDLPIAPNPDKTDNRDMYLKRPRKHPRRLFAILNKDLIVPNDLKKKYEKNNKENHDK